MSKRLFRSAKTHTNSSADPHIQPDSDQLKVMLDEQSANAVWEYLTDLPSHPSIRFLKDALEITTTQIQHMIGPKIQPLINKIPSKRVQKRVFSSVLIIFVVTVLFLIGLLIYSAFYYVYIGEAFKKMEIYVDYSGLNEYHDYMHSIHYKGPQFGDTQFQPQSGVYNHRQITRNIIISGKSSLIKHSYDIQGEPERLLFPVDETFDLLVELEVPESEWNMKLGNFMVKLTLTNEDHQVVAESVRPGILKYKSVLSKSILTLSNLIPALLGISTQETQTIRIPMMSQMTEPKAQYTSDALIQIMYQPLQMYEARLLLQTHYKGLQRLMTKYWFQTGALTIGWLMILELFLFSVGYRMAILYYKRNLAKQQTALISHQKEAESNQESKLDQDADCTLVESKDNDLAVMEGEEIEEGFFSFSNAISSFSATPPMSVTSPDQ